ncbi:MAG: serine/threonine protein kinase [Myxococcales bacterium]|nr:serine/threonine protein kinase [Myxococcales bacterium]
MSAVLGKYRLEQRLGGGGMAEVFLASTIGAEGFSRKVAIKRVLPGFSDNPAFSSMFVAEAQLSSRLVHPNIVSVLDFDRGPDGGLFLVMELVEGKDLDGLNSTGLLPIPVVIFTISEVLRGLGYAHDLPGGADMRGIVHRDVSPHNVLLSWEGAVKVSDFGIAKARSASEATASVFIKGKPAYMSPEQANGSPLDGRSDLFAVGVMLWEMLVGRRLFVGEDTRSTLAAVLFGQIPRPRSIRGDIPKDLEKVVMKLLERDLPARYPTAEAAIHDLLECHDAPKRGREMLIQLLQERFPQQAQLRGSLMRQRSMGSGQGMTPVPLPPGARTIADGSVGPSGTPQHQMPAAQIAYAAPSVSSVMQARTGTLEGPPRSAAPPRRGNGLKIALVVLVTLASAAGAFLIVAKVRGDKAAPDAGAGSPDTVASVAPPTIDAAAAPPTPVDAAPPPADAATPADASAPAPPPPPDAPAPVPVDAGSTIDAQLPKPPEVKKAQGKLEVRAFPVLTVYLDNKRLGDTPITRMVPVGKHTLRLVNTDRGYDEKLPIVISADKPVSIERMK